MKGCVSFGKRTSQDSGFEKRNACGVCTHELQLTAQQLQRDYMSAGSGWKDEQYKNLGQIVEDSCTAILQPIPQLENCQKWLQELAALVEKYET